MVKQSPWAYVRDSSYSYPKHSYDLVVRDGETMLQYRRQQELASQLWFELPGYYGWQELSYDRVQSVGVQYGPEWTIPGADILIQTTLGWHALLGGVDPGVHLRAPVGAAWTLNLDARRETHTNEAWIASTLDNTATTLIFGQDVRNYYRAWHGEAALSRPIEFMNGLMSLSLGAQFERAHSLQTAVPPGVWRSSGSRVRFPTSTTRLMFAMSPLLSSVESPGYSAGPSASSGSATGGSANGTLIWARATGHACRITGCGWSGSGSARWF